MPADGQGTHVVVDGSNLATEGRSVPSLAQLKEAVAAFKEEHPDDNVTVVVDASFGYRIDEPERPEFEAAEAEGEYVSPPAGAIGRGDGFLLQIADRTGAVVLSNDSFQEFHGTYDWLFERGRLIGGKPVPGVGWIFSLRTPVRGPRSRDAVKDKKKKDQAEKAKVEKAIAEAKEEALEPGARSPRRRGGRRGKAGPPPGAVNEPLTFITFIAEHRLGDEVEGEVDRFSSHGAFVVIDGATCYVPLAAMGEPPPRSAREAFKRGDRLRFVVQALDAPRRGLQLALPGYARVAAVPTEETVAAEIHEGAAKKQTRGKRKAAAAKPVQKKKAAPAKKAAKKQQTRGTKKAAAAKPVQK